MTAIATSAATTYDRISHCNAIFLLPLSLSFGPLLCAIDTLSTPCACAVAASDFDLFFSSIIVLVNGPLSSPIAQHLWIILLSTR